MKNLHYHPQLLWGLHATLDFCLFVLDNIGISVINLLCKTKELMGNCSDFKT